MSKRVLTFIVAGLLATALPRAGEGTVDAAAPVSTPAAALAGGDAPAVAEAVRAGREDASRLEFRSPGKVNPYREHAPLAFFSLGSLAVGGVFYGIHQGLDDPGSPSFSGDGTRVNLAIGAAGITALAAGAAYLWYALRPDGPDVSGWSETVAAGITSDGGVAASVTVPLASLLD